MKVDLNFALKDQQGNELLISKDTPMMAKDVVAGVLDNPTETTAKDIVKLIKRSKLAKSISDGKKVEIEDEDLDEIKKMVASTNLKISVQVQILEALGEKV